MHNYWTNRVWTVLPAMLNGPSTADEFVMYVWDSPAGHERYDSNVGIAFGILNYVTEYRILVDLVRFLKVAHSGKSRS